MLTIDRLVVPTSKSNVDDDRETTNPTEATRATTASDTPRVADVELGPNVASIMTEPVLFAARRYPDDTASTTELSLEFIDARAVTSYANDGASVRYARTFAEA
jgi:hypothetical protein